MMNCRQIIRCYFILTSALLFAPQPKALAQNLPINECERDLYKVFSVDSDNKPKKLTVSPSVIMNGPMVQQVNSQEQLLVGKPPIKSIIAIESSPPSFWRMRVNEADLPFLKAKYKVEPTDNGVGNPFNHADAISSRIDRVKECVDRDGKKTLIVEGAIIFHFTELSKFSSGNFNGEVDVCVETKDIKC